MLSELAEQIGAQIDGPPDAGSRVVKACNTLEAAGPGDISFLSNPKYGKHLATTTATAVVVSNGTPRPREAATVLLRARNPYYAFTLAMVRVHGHRQHPHTGIHPRAFVDPSAVIGQGTVVYPNAYIGPNVVVGNDCIIYPNATIYDRSVLGDRVIIHAGAVIGQDGYGYATNKDPDGVTRHHKIPQVGIVRLEDDVEIGANCTIARAAMGETVIGQGTKLDSAVVIGHGTVIGKHGLLVAQVGVAGSVEVGNYATIAGQVGIAGHLKLGDNVTIAGKSGVMQDIDSHSTVMGFPAMPVNVGRRVWAAHRQLPEIVERIRKLEQSVEELADEGSAE
jgi:UDP-3-O-[3-hydroxymyristoyl] glucosamine N-acyltransferase